jgi:2-keto-4-pentenoate hydratase/2-oxohepta-3-ene-1,7-dioic acid hydratase in catechol pathway
MKVVKFIRQGSREIGLVTDDGIVSISRRDPSLRDIDDVVSSDGWRRAAAMAHGAADTAMSEVKLLPPLATRARIFCVGLNYKSHVEETANEPPPHPTLFLRTHESFVGPGQPMIRPHVSQSFDYEGELAVLIGTSCHRVDEAEALDYVGGYTCLNEGSVRDFQKHSTTGMTGKNFDASGALGPWVVSTSDIPHPDRLQLRTRLNGAVVQEASTDQLIYSIVRIISYLSSCLRLHPGDVIATGTPAGVGSRRVPPLWMKAGDRIEIEIGGIGTLVNDVVDEPA